MKKRKKETKPSKQAKNKKNAIDALLSSKEQEIVREEIADSTAPKRNAPILNTIALREPAMIPLLFDPAYLPMFTVHLHDHLKADSALTGNLPTDVDVFEELAQSLSDTFDPSLAINVMLRVLKQTKVKRERRVLLWAIGDLIRSTAQKEPLARCIAFRTLISASIVNATNLYQRTDLFMDGKEPYNFNYQKVLDKTYTQSELQNLADSMKPNVDSFYTLLSMRSMLLFQDVKKPFGLRFFNIIHYPSAAGKSASRLIITPNQQEESKEENVNERNQRLSEALIKDLPLSPPQDLIKNMVTSLKTAAFGEVEKDVLEPLINAAVFSMMVYFRISPFVFNLYRESGENAVKLNPEDETNAIIDIQCAPDNPDAYRRYADLLYEKGEKTGAFSVYSRLQEILDGQDEHVSARIEELKPMAIQRFEESIVFSMED